MWAMLLLCAARWDQMKQVEHVRFNLVVKNAACIISGCLAVAACVSHIVGIAAPKINGFNHILTIACAAALDFGSLIFDCTICVILGNAVIKSKKSIALEKQNRMFRINLALLLIVDFFKLAATLIFSSSPRYQFDGVTLAIAGVIIHVFVSKRLLRNLITASFGIKGDSKSSRAQTKQGGAVTEV